MFVHKSILRKKKQLCTWACIKRNARSQKHFEIIIIYFRVKLFQNSCVSPILQRQKYFPSMEKNKNNTEWTKTHSLIIFHYKLNFCIIISGFIRVLEFWNQEILWYQYFRIENFSLIKAKFRALETDLFLWKRKYWY